MAKEGNNESPVFYGQGGKRIGGICMLTRVTCTPLKAREAEINGKYYFPLEYHNLKVEELYECLEFEERKFYSQLPVKPVFHVCPHCGVNQFLLNQACCIFYQQHKEWFETKDEADKYLPLVQLKHLNPSWQVPYELKWESVKNVTFIREHLPYIDLPLPFYRNIVMDDAENIYLDKETALLIGILLLPLSQVPGMSRLEVQKLFRPILDYFAKQHQYEKTDDFLVDFILEYTWILGFPTGMKMVSNASDFFIFGVLSKLENLFRSIKL